jgi:hypothetical protein
MPAVPVVVQAQESVVEAVPVLTDVLSATVGAVLVPVVGRPSARASCPVRSRERNPAPASTIARTTIRTTS